MVQATFQVLNQEVTQLAESMEVMDANLQQKHTNDIIMSTTMEIKCYLCKIHSANVTAAYQHSQTRHQPELSASKYSVTSCVRCPFTHSNPLITKLHFKVSHNDNSEEVLYISNHRFVSRSTAIRETKLYYS